MSAHPQLGPDFWLQFTPFPPFTSDRGKDFQWNPRFVSLIESKAATYFLDLTISERHIAQSAMLLASLLGDTDRSGREPIDRSAELIPVLVRRLHALAKTPQRLHEMIDVDQAFGDLAVPVPTLKSPLLYQFATNTIISSSNPAKCILVLELFDLVERLQAADTCIRLIQKATEVKAMDGARKLVKRQGSDSRTRQQMQFSAWKFEIKWPLGTLTLNGEQIISKQEQQYAGVPKVCCPTQNATQFRQLKRSNCLSMRLLTKWTHSTKTPMDSLAKTKPHLRILTQ
jgi:hypothetical protein